MTGPTRPPRAENSPSSGAMLRAYLGLHEAPPRRPDPRPHALWVAVLAAILIAAIVPGQSGVIAKVVWVAVIVFVSTIIFMTAVRVQYGKLLDRHGPSASSPAESSTDDTAPRS